ncbi:MAG: DUF721 domain-containing protein [Methylocystis sp.]
MSAPSRAKGFRARSLADYVSRELDPLIAARGFGEASLLLCWREIVGARISRICAPDALRWPPRTKAKASDPAPKRRDKTPREPATLVLRVDPGFGLEAQHLAPIIIDRVNAHLGWRCVTRIALRQEALASAPASLRPVSSRQLPADAAARARAVKATEGVAEEGLRAALVRLGERALSGSNGAPRDA